MKIVLIIVAAVLVGAFFALLFVRCVNSRLRRKRCGAR